MKKEQIQQLRIADYNYPLPDDKIAKYPLEKRDESKLLWYDGKRIDTFHFKDLPDLLPAQTLLIFNNTRVIHARLLFQKSSGAKIEVFCLSPFVPADYAVNFQQRESCEWNCMIGNAKRWKDGPLSMVVSVGTEEVLLTAEKIAIHDNDMIVRFSWNCPKVTFSELLERAGKLPIPPYLSRPTEDNDEVTYQTVYSCAEGSVAAPTAGLHFTDEVLRQLKIKGVRTAEVTLHVGAGTFKPVKSETISGHEMHTEFITVPAETIRWLADPARKIIVVGTTSLRTVESLYYMGCKLEKNPGASPSDLSVKQWDPYDNEVDISPAKASRNLLRYLEFTGQDRLISSTQLIIAPGYRFHYPDGIITNFHQPQSTLLLLISAFVGEDWRKIYEYALQNNYRFLSYGDSSLLWKKSK